MQDRTKKVKIAEAQVEQITCSKMRKDPKMLAFVEKFLGKCRKLELKAPTMETS